MARSSKSKLEERLAALERIGLLGASPEPGIQRLAEITRTLLQTPAVLVSLVDDKNQIHIADAHAEDAEATDKELPLTHSLCRYVVEGDETLIVKDLRNDQRFKDHPVVKEHDVAAYIGIPLRTADNTAYGSLCAIDHQPRDWSDEELDSLYTIAEAIESEIEVRALLAERNEALKQQKAARKRLEAKRRRLQMLARIGKTTAEIDDHRYSLPVIAKLATAELGDWCMIELTSIKGEERHAYVSANDRETEQDLLTLRSYAADAQWNLPKTTVHQSHESVFLEHASLERILTIDAAKLSDTERSLITKSSDCAVGVIPIMWHEQLYGTITYVRSSTNGTAAFDPLEQEMQIEIARRAAFVIESSSMREALKQRAEAAEVIKAIGDGVILIDSDSKIGLWNPAMTEITGIEETAALQKNLSDVLPEIASVTNKESTSNRTQLIRLKLHGDDHWLACTAVRSEQSTVLAVRDVTAEHKLERTRKDLIATVSHQLRTPITSIMAAAMTLERDDINLDTETSAAMIGMITEQGRRLTDLCDEVLLAHRLEDQESHLSISSISLQSILEELAETFSPQLTNKHRLSLVPSSSELLVLGNEQSLRQVFSNLIDNAIKYSINGGEITITTEENAGNIIVKVRDEGVGIPEAEHKAIFERFHRLDPKMRLGVGGTGLGLYVVQGLVRAMNGEIDVAQPEGGGTEMIVTLRSALTPANI